MSGFTLRRTILLFSLLFVSLCAHADAGNESLIKRGDAAYVRKAYDSAVSYYEQASRGKTPDALALYKLGNAHYRLRHIGEAMLAYERSLLHRPGFAAAAHNARLIQQQVRPGNNKEVFFVRWWQSITASEWSNTWAILAILLITGALSALSWGYYRKQWPGWMRPQVLGGTFLLAALFILFSLTGSWRDKPSSAAVVMRPDVKFKPLATGSKGSLALPEGLLVQVLHNKGDELTICLPDGQEGFVQRSDIALVE